MQYIITYTYTGTDPEDDVHEHVEITQEFILNGSDRDVHEAMNKVKKAFKRALKRIGYDFYEIEEYLTEEEEIGGSYIITVSFRDFDFS